MKKQRTARLETYLQSSDAGPIVTYLSAHLSKVSLHSKKNDSIRLWSNVCYYMVSKNKYRLPLPKLLHLLLSLQLPLKN